MGIGMTKQESLSILQSINQQMDALSNEELFDYMMKNSPTFRADMKGGYETKSDNNYCTIKITASDIIITINIEEAYKLIDSDLYKTVSLSGNTVETEKGDWLCLIAA